MALAETSVQRARDVDLSRAPRIGAVFGIAVIFISAIGMVGTFATRSMIGSAFSLSRVLLALLAFTAGYVATQPPPQLEGYRVAEPSPRLVGVGSIAGAIAGAMLGLFAILVDSISIRDIFVEFTPELVGILTFEQGTGLGFLLLLLLGSALGAAGGAVRLMSARIRRALFAAIGWTLGLALLQILFTQIFNSLQLDFLTRLLYRGASGGLSVTSAPAVAVALFLIAYAGQGRVKKAVTGFRGLQGEAQRKATVAGMAVLLIILGALPHVLGNFLSSAMDIAGTFLLMALGLNIVIGFAGLLDLGYVAFFAVGAYTTSVLTSTSGPAFSPELTFWTALPFVMMAAALAGLLVGTPVLRMRGDYLAIVTLGFGEIARLITLSDWQASTLGGAQGIANVPPIPVGPWNLVEAQEFFYIIFGFVLLFAYITYALQASRMGRAWNAMREDQAVAEAMGVNIVAAKLWAFVLGAIMASLGGAMFAHRVGTVFPHSFNIIVSITVVVIVIVGGMGSVPGVIVGALVLVGLPELLREFEEFRFLLYGVVLIFMMLKRPEGFIPSRRRQREIHEDEVAQDAWLRAETERQREEEAAGSTGPERT
ncbi:MAG TPA: leucine/isoleucine/valine transporter permease subunit [Actinomycetota bacterium]